MSSVEKIGNEIWFDVGPEQELRLRHGPQLTWFGAEDDVLVTSVKATSAGLKKRALKMPLVESSITANAPISVLAKIGTKLEVWKVNLTDMPFYFKGQFYLGHSGEMNFTARKLDFDNFQFMIEPKGNGTLYLALPKGITNLDVKGRKISTPSDKIAIIIGNPEFKKQTNREELKSLFSKGGWARTGACEMTGVEQLYIYGGTVNSPMGLNQDDETT